MSGKDINIVPLKCKNCNKDFSGRITAKFCSKTCCGEYNYLHSSLYKKRLKRKELKEVTTKERRKCKGCDKYFTWKSNQPSKEFHDYACRGRFLARQKNLELATQEKPTITDETGKLIPFNGRYLTLSHYKEPLKPVVKGEGFGYMGALCGTVDGSLVQCHICGELFQDVGKHSVQFHKLGAIEYREKFELAKTTALCSEKSREDRKKNFMKYLATVSEEEKAAFRARLKERQKEWWKNNPDHNKGTKISLETKNKRGVCPDQLLDQIQKVADKLGRTPSKNEFITETGTQRYVHLIYKTYGSWKNALKMLEMEQKRNASHDKGSIHKEYTSEELLEYLTIFAQENNKVPTATDFRRGLLPAYETYTRRFGGIEKARQMANVYDYVDDPELVTGYAAKYKKEAQEKQNKEFEKLVNANNI